VTGRDLDVPERDAGIEGWHDERGSQHVRMHGAEIGTLSDRPDPSVGGSPVESVAVTAPQDRSLVALTDGQVDRPSRAGDERDRGRLVALAHDPQRAVATLDAEVLDVGGTGLADTQPVPAQQHGQRRVIPVVLLRSE
jgi:predicted Abi (CAAX) family protease